MNLSVETLKSDALDLWRAASTGSPAPDSCYTVDQQVQKEAEVDRLMRDVDISIDKLKRSGYALRKENAGIRSRIQRSIVQLLHSFDCVIDPEMERSFSIVTGEFIERAYEFDAQIGDEAVYQASRNVLIMNTFQMQLGRKIALTPSVFAYSMLYPYTDNYLDAVDISAPAKDERNEWMLLRLSGIAAKPRNRQERIVDRLVGMIEAEYDRRAYGNVYDSILAIHNAQTRSVSQQCDNLSAAELLEISIEKGGASVLADGYLIAGEVSAADAEFFFQFGVLLQLIDDLQDLQEDRSLQHLTLAGCAAAKGSLDNFTNQLLSFAATVLNPARFHQEKLRILIGRSCRLLILEAIACNYNHYSDRYLLAMERCSPVRFKYLRNAKQQMKGKYDPHQFEELRKYRLPGRGFKRRNASECEVYAAS